MRILIVQQARTLARISAFNLLCNSDGEESKWKKRLQSV
jgi:hypothetical protein